MIDIPTMVCDFVAPVAPAPVAIRPHPKTAQELERVVSDYVNEIRFPTEDQRLLSPPQISAGWRGVSKSVYRPEYLDDEESLFVCNQDVLLRAVYHDDAQPQNIVRLWGVFDGHGVGGEIVAKRSAETLRTRMASTWGDLVAAVQHADPVRLRAFWEARFAEMDHGGYSSGGSTCTVVCSVTLADGRSVITTANVGDSPAGLVDHRSGAWVSLSADHSWENPDEMGKYRGRCARDGRLPGNALYSRFNCPNGFRLEDADGEYEPLHLYEPFDPNDPQKVVIHRANAEVMMRFTQMRPQNAGGMQSARKMLIERQTPDGAWETSGVMPEAITQNWGSTMEGAIQPTRTIGDDALKRRWHLCSTPEISCIPIENGQSGTIVIGSDGIFDPFYFHEMADLMIEASTMWPSDGQAAVDHVYDTLQHRPSGAFKWQNGVPRWDDVSLFCIHFES